MGFVVAPMRHVAPVYPGTKPNRPVQTPPKVGRRVRRGIKWLNQTTPGWEERVTPARINLSSDYNCILGQVYRSLYDAPIGDARFWNLWLIPWGIRRGFIVRNRPKYEQQWRDYVIHRRVANLAR